LREWVCNEIGYPPQTPDSGPLKSPQAFRTRSDRGRTSATPTTDMCSAGGLCRVPGDSRRSGPESATKARPENRQAVATYYYHGAIGPSLGRTSPSRTYFTKKPTEPMSGTHCGTRLGRERPVMACFPSCAMGQDRRGQRGPRMRSGSHRRRRVEPTEEWEQIELLCAWPEQREYELIRPLVLFGGVPPPVARRRPARPPKARCSGRSPASRRRGW
jgi:hypothetical protein